ncbi:BatD family protein [Haloferula sargassicola]|uniref:Protein BatD n=1 Tax=Haloferula sargassicola TaxID=490096 RepID=A0ABP9UL64_9BACT
MARILSLWLLFAWCALRADGVSAELSTDTVEAGQGAMLTLQVEGSHLDEMPGVPEVKDLIVNPRGQSQNVQIINGRMSRSIQFSYVVGSHVPGDYVIPSIPVRIGGQVLKTEPLKLTVRPSASGAPQGMDDEEEAGQSADDADFGFLTFGMVKTDRKHVYPGEIAPVRIQGYFPLGARVTPRGNPHPEGSAFTLHHLSDEPKQEIKVMDGKRYSVITWYGGLSATKAGEYPARIVWDVTVAVRDRAARRRPSGMPDPFMGGSLLDDLFAPVVQKDVELKTPDPPTLEVKELPVDGRPDDFTGAIGSFEFKDVSIPKAMRTGEPVRIEASIAGKGNFALLEKPEPLPADDWKTYAGHDEFVPGDAASFGGTKQFDFNAVPKVPGKRDLKLGFSYFDPDQGEYRRVESEPEPVEITGPPMVDEQPEEAPEIAEAPKTEEPKLAPIRTDPGKVKPFEPLTEAAWFVPTAAGCGALSLAILIWGGWRQRRDDPSVQARREARLAEARALARADEAAKAGDAAAFFEAAREALARRVGEVAGIRPEAVTLADLEGRVDREVTELWRLADRIDYSGEAAGRDDLPSWLSMLERGMKSLTGEVQAA